MLKAMCGRMLARLYQKKIWTNTGVPRKNHMYNQLTLDTTGLGDSRITAITMPSTTPMSMASTVSSRVTTIPCRIRRPKRYCWTAPQLIPGAVTKM